MAAEEENPFRRALDEKKGAEVARLRPFKPPDERLHPTKAAKLRTVAELELVDGEVLGRNPRVASLTVQDLEDLAIQFQGVPTFNPNISNLTIEDLQDLEGVFLDYKLNAAREIQGLAAGELASVDVSCCCCTPCCCCAAAELEPVRA